MSTVKGVHKASSSSKKSAPQRIAIPAATPAPELLRFLELSVGEKTDAYLLKLALRDARADSIAEASGKLLARLEQMDWVAPAHAAIKAGVAKPSVAKKRKLITGVVTLPKSLLWRIHHWAGSKFTVVVDAISHSHNSQTPLMRHLSMTKLRPNTVLFSSTSFRDDEGFTLSFANIEQSFEISPSMLSPLQIFNAETLSMDSKTIELRLVEKSCRLS